MLIHCFNISAVPYLLCILLLAMVSSSLRILLFTVCSFIFMMGYFYPPSYRKCSNYSTGRQSFCERPNIKYFRLHLCTEVLVYLNTVKKHPCIIFIHAEPPYSVGDPPAVPPCTDMYPDDVSAYRACMTAFALQHNWYPSPIAGSC